MLFFLSEKQVIVALGSRLGPCLWHELPVVVGLCLDGSHLLYRFHQVVTLVALAAVDDAAVKTILRDAGTTGQELASAIATIAVHSHLVPLLLIEWLAVAHAQNLHLLAIWLRNIYLVIDAGGTVEIE